MKDHDRAYYAEKAREGAVIIDGLLALFKLYKDDDWNILDQAWSHLKVMHEDEEYGVPLTIPIARWIANRGGK